jgi:hypothetical protein
MPLLIVFATSTEMKAPTRFSTAATPTATFGCNAPVAMLGGDRWLRDCVVCGFSRRCRPVP